MWGSRRDVFRERNTDIIIYLLELPADNVCWDCRIIYRLGCWNNASGEAEERHYRQDCWGKGSRVAERRRACSLPGSLYLQHVDR